MSNNGPFLKVQHMPSDKPLQWHGRPSVRRESIANFDLGPVSALFPNQPKCKTGSYGAIYLDETPTQRQEQSRHRWGR